MRAMTGLWRWRGNPLRRPTDLAEAWTALGAAVLIALGVPLCGLLAGLLVHQDMARAVLEQQHQRTLVTATVVRALPHPPVDSDPETSTARDAHRPVVSGWTAPDGTLRTGTVLVGKEHTPGNRFRIWTDSRGRIVQRPLDSTTAASHAVLAGSGAGAAAGALVEGARRLVVWRLMVRRYEQWDREWEEEGQDWGRTGTGS